VRGLWLLEKYKILTFLYKSFEIFRGILHVKTLHDLACIDESLHMLYVLKSCQKTSENSSKDHPYSIWVVVKEVITKRCFRFRVHAQ
jgi:hypothetical protein